MRTLVIGDIHGALKALKQVLEKANYNPLRDRLIFLGDYVDGWSQSAEVVQFIIELMESASLSSVSPDMVITILGNHDKWAANWLLNGDNNPNWLVQGGASTVESYISTGHITDQSHKDFFSKLMNYFIDEDNRAFVHGGYTHPDGLGNETYVADYYWNRDMFSVAMSGHSSNKSLTDKLPRLLRPHKEIYIGHTATVNWDYGTTAIPAPEGYKKGDAVMTPLNACNVWNMDTGAGFYGKLTIMDIDTKEYWQSDLTKELYPNEKGR